MWIIYTLARPPDRKPYHVGIIGPHDSGDKVEPDDAIMSIYGTVKTCDAAISQQKALIERYHIKPPAPPVSKKEPPIPVRCITTGTTYKSANAACRAHHIDKGAMSTHLRHPDMFPHVRGLKFERLNR